MDLNGLPADVAQFVDDALASGKYPSAEDLVAAALQALQQQEEDRGTPHLAAAPEAGSPPASPDDYLQALAGALRTGEFGRAGSWRSPGPPAILSMRNSPRRPGCWRHRPSPMPAPAYRNIQANRAWLRLIGTPMRGNGWPCTMAISSRRHRPLTHSRPR